MSEIEPLSLETFDPIYAREPYLNTPRSLRACHVHGIHPEELVEIPFREFQRAYPDDPETALRKFERVDGARKRVLEEVVKTWKEICDYESRHPKKELSEDTEVIIKVDPEIHTKILEIQADHFHKTEKKQFKALQTIIFHEMKKAVVEQMSKKIIQKQNNMEEIKKRQRMQHEAAVEAKHRMEREEIEERERELAKEIKLAQKEYMEAVKQKSELDKENIRREKQQQYKRETERLQREEYFKKQKEHNYKRFHREAIERSQQLQLREQEISDRLEMERRKKEEENKKKRAMNDRRLNKVKDELNKMEQEKKDLLNSKIESFNKQYDTRKQWKQEQYQKHLEERGDFYSDKLTSIRETNDQLLKEKVEKITTELEHKDQKAQNELNRIEFERERRRVIKEVRTEAHALSAARKKKADDFRKQRILESIQKKNERYEAIKTGEKTLRSMTDKMEEVMSKTKAEIRMETMRLISKDQLSPDKVMDVVKAHSEKVLFPRLENRFGDTASHDFHDTHGHTTRPMTTTNLSLSQSLGGHSASARTTPHTRTTNSSSGTRQLRPKSPSSGVHLKVFSMDRLEESLTAIKQSTVDIVSQMDPSSPLHSPHLDDDFPGKTRTASGTGTGTATGKSSSKTGTGKQVKKRREGEKRQQQHHEGEGEGEEGEDDDWLFDREDLSPLRHITSPKDGKGTRAYHRQTTPYPEEISEATLEKENELSARFRGSHDNELISEERDEDEGGSTSGNGNGNGKKQKFTRTYTLGDAADDYGDDQEGRKVQFQDHDSHTQQQQRSHTEPSRGSGSGSGSTSAHRKDSFKTRKQTPFPHEIEEANNLSTTVDNETEEGEEIDRKKKSFQQRKNTPFPHQMEEEIKKSARYSSREQESFIENEEDHGDHEDLLLPALRDGEHDPEFDSYRQQQQTQQQQPVSHLFADLDDEELHQKQQYPQSSSARSGSGRGGRGGEERNSSYEGSQSVPRNAMSRQRLSSQRQSSADSFSSSASQSNSQKNIRLRPLTPEGHFRREFSKDHPLAGGQGKYSRETSQGKEWMGPNALVQQQQQQRKGGGKGKKLPLRISEIVSKQEQKKLDLQRQLEELRKHQNEVLLEVLEEERQAELERVEMGRTVSDHEERRRLEMVFAEERKRASERIISLTKHNERKMKDVILAMELG